MPRSLKRRPVAGVDAARRPAVGAVIQSRIDAWRGSAIVTMNPVVQAPASATGAASETISVEAADPTPHQRVPPIRPQRRDGAALHQPNSRRAAGPSASLKPAFPKGHLCAKRRKMLPTPPANVQHPHHGDLQAPPPPDLTVLNALPPAVPVHGTTAPDSTTEPLDPGASAGWSHHSWLQRQKPSCSEWAGTNPTAATQSEWRWQQTGCHRRPTRTPNRASEGPQERAASATPSLLSPPASQLTIAELERSLSRRCDSARQPTTCADRGPSHRPGTSPEASCRT